MVPKQGKTRGKQGAFTYNHIFDMLCDLKLLASLQNLKKTYRGVAVFNKVASLQLELQ